MLGYCPHCGIREEKGAEVCPHCKQNYSIKKSMKGVPALGAAGIGWTPYAKDATLKHHMKKTKKGMRIGMAIVSIIIAAVIMISSHMDFDDLMNGGYVTVLGPLAIIWVFWFIWMTLNFKKTKGWEGEVINKDCKTYENKNRDEDGNVTKSYSTYYNIYFRDTNGKERKLVQSNTGAWYEYLQVGDRIRYHGTNTNYYEKFDKSKEPFIPCAGCGARCDARATYCSTCGVRLFKASEPAYAKVQEREYAESEMSACAAVEMAADAMPRMREGNTDGQVRQDADGRAIARFCEKCGTQFEPGSRFCEKCGAKLE